MIFSRRSLEISAVLPQTISSILLFLANLSKFSPFLRMSISCLEVIRQSRMMISFSFFLTRSSWWLRRSSSLCRCEMRFMVLQVVKLHLAQSQQLLSSLLQRSLYSLAIRMSFWKSGLCLYSSQYAALMQLLLGKLIKLSILCLMMPMQLLVIASTSLRLCCKSPFLLESMILLSNLYKNRQQWISLTSILEITRFQYLFSWVATGLMFLVVELLCSGFSLARLVGVSLQLSEDLSWMLWLMESFLKLTNLFCEYSFAFCLFSLERQVILRGSAFSVLGVKAWKLQLLEQLARRSIFSFFSMRMFSLPLLNEKSTRAQSDILAVLSSLRVFLRKSLEVLLICSLGRSSSIFQLSIFLSSSFSFLAFQGVSPVSISQKMMPSAQISVFRVYSFLLRDSGAMQRGDPTLYLLDLRASHTLIAKPKSAILSYPSLMRMLAGLRSRWMMLLLAKLRQPRRIWCMYWQAQCSESPFLTTLLRSLSQSSVMMQVLFLVVKTSWRVSMWDMLLSSLSTSISLSRSTLLMSFLSILRSMTLTATGWLESSLRPLQTWLEQPFPMTSLRPQEQCQIFLRVQLVLMASQLVWKSLSNNIQQVVLIKIIQLYSHQQQNYPSGYRQLSIITGSEEGEKMMAVCWADQHQFDRWRWTATQAGLQYIAQSCCFPIATIL